MLPRDADPVLFEVQDLWHELHDTRRALLADYSRLSERPDEAWLRRALTALGDAERREGHTQEEAARELTAQLPAELAELVHAATELHGRLTDLVHDREHAETIDRALTRHTRVLRIAVEVRRAELRERLLEDEADALMHRAAASARSLTRGEAERVTELGIPRGENAGIAAWEAQLASEHLRDSVLLVLASMRVREARAQLRDGLLLTGQMRRIIAEASPAAHRGDPVLLIGETGGAKTALAEHLARIVTGADPEFVSGYGDITGSQVIGTHELRAEKGATVSAFVPGPLLRAMAEGRAVILDELNAMPPEFLKRLNRVLQMRPGDRFAVQENAGRPVVIAPGFVILATANEQTPHRYLGLERLSAELVNRFGANAYRVHYPDTGISYTGFPAENALLATAAVADRFGELRGGISSVDIERVSRAAFISQQVFAGTHGEGFDAFVSTEHEIDGRPGLEESVLAPRTLVAVLEKVAASGGKVTLDQALGRFVEGLMHREDRRVLALILQGQGFAL